MDQNYLPGADVTFRESSYFVRNCPKYVSEEGYDSQIRAKQIDDIITQMELLR